MSDQRKGKTRPLGRGSGDNYSTAGAGGDSHSSTLNAEAPEFCPPVSLMRDMHLDQTRYAAQSPNFGSHQQTMTPASYSRVVGSSGSQSGDASDLVQATVVRIRKQEKLHVASDMLISYLNNNKGVEAMISVAKNVMSLGENADRSKVDSVLQLTVFLAEKFRHTSRSFSQFMLNELNERLVQWQRTCSSNSGFVTQCEPFLFMLASLYPTLVSMARGQSATTLGLSIVSFFIFLLQSDNPDGHQQVLSLLFQLGSALQDELSDKDDQTSEVNNGGTGSGNKLERLYQYVREHIVHRRFANAELAMHFISLLELRAANWGRHYQRQSSAEGSFSRQNSEAMMDDEMYECYERFLAETGQI